MKCKQCPNEKVHALGLCRKCYDKKNKDKILRQHREWDRNNPEKIKATKDKERFGGNRQLALERDNFQCQDCGMTQEQHLNSFGQGLTVDHIDGKGRCSKVKNHKLENLRTQCCRCHPIKDKPMYMKRRWGDLIKQDDSDWKYPKIRYLVEIEIKKGLGVQDAKRKVSEDTGMGFSLIDHRYYMKKPTTSKTSKRSEDKNAE